MSSFSMAAELGIEPRQRDSETLVLPLHNSAKLRSLLQAGLIIPQFSDLSRHFLQKSGSFFTKKESEENSPRTQWVSVLISDPARKPGPSS